MSVWSVGKTIVPREATSGAFGSYGGGGGAALPPLLLPSPLPVRWEPIEMNSPVLVRPMSLATTLEMNASRAMTSCLRILSRSTLSSGELGHIAA